MFGFIAQRFLKLWKWIRRRWKVSLFIALVLVGIGFWQFSRMQNNQPEYTFVPVEQKNLIKTLELSGIIDSEQRARLRFAAGGELVSLPVSEGEPVKLGQTIAVIDQASLRKKLDQNLNSFMQERLDWDQTIDDVYEGEYTQDEERVKEKAQLDLLNSVLTVEIQNISIQDTVLSAPFNGIVTSMPSNSVGTQLLATDYFEVINPDSVVFVATVDEIDLSSLELGQMAEIELDAYPDEFIQTFVDYIAYTSSQNSTGTVFIVKFPLNQAGLEANSYRIGLNGDVSVEVDRRENTLVIPLDTTRERDDQTYVDVKIADNEVEERAIEVGLESDTEIEVLSGLQAGDLVVQPE